MTHADLQIVSAVAGEIETALAFRKRRPAVIGICGAQGSGKSTLSADLLEHCREQGLSAAVLSIDDLYLTRAERDRLAREVHPLLATRGPPGTHDIGLGLEVLAALERGDAAGLPRFDKGRDDRASQQEWDAAPVQCQVLMLEGWCVGAVPQSEEELAEPVNALEAGEDPQGTWRAYVNTALAGPYQRLFSRIDCLVLLAAPSFDVVFEWRLQQERELRERAGAEATRAMDEAGVARFIQHYERLTRHILAEMPSRADLLVRLNERREPLDIHRRSAG